MNHNRPDSKLGLFQSALRPALATAGLVADPVAGGVLEAGVSHVLVFRLLDFSLVAGRRIAGIILADDIRSFDRIDRSAINSIWSIGVIDHVTVRMGCSYLEIVEMNGDRDVLVVLIQTLSILLVSAVDETFKDSSLRGAVKVIRRRTRDGSGLVGVSCGLIGRSELCGLIIICGGRVGSWSDRKGHQSRHRADPDNIQQLRWNF